MATSAPAATGMSISSAGGSAALTGGGAATGLEGLFSVMVGSSVMGSNTPSGAGTSVPDSGLAALLQTPVLSGTDGLISVMLGSGSAVTGGTASALTDVTSMLAAQGTTTQTQVQLGKAAPLTITGDAQAVATFVQQLQDVYQKLVVDGGLTIDQLSDSKILASALTKLGLTADEATGVAGRIETMLKQIKDQQAVDDATAGSLTAMMLTVMGQQQVAAMASQSGAQVGAQVDSKTLSLQIISVEQPATAGGQAATMTALQFRAGGDVTRDLLGLSGGRDVKDGKADATATPPVRALEVAVTNDGDATIAVAVPDVKTPVRVATTPRVATDAVPSDAAQAAAAVTTTGTAVKVAADARIEAPKGETYYKLQADKNGVETLEAVKPTSEVRDAGLLAQQAVQQPVAAAVAQATVDAATSSAFAARVAEIQAMVDKADVAKQVTVQMQPLLAEGGGQIRINLHPKDLGQITIDLKVSEGKVQGTIAASEPAVVEQLARELHSLRHGLADAGLKLGEQGINLMLSNQGQNGQGNGQGGQFGAQPQASGRSGSGRAAGGSPDAATSELASNISAWVSPDRMLDVNV